MMDVPTPASCLFVLMACLFCVGCQTAHAQEKRLPPGEVEALKQIDAKLKVGWDFSVNPCSGTNGWLTKAGRNVTCGNCNTTTNICHVTDVILKSQNLSGVLPDEFANLTSLIQIDLTRNYINGTIPAAWSSLPRLVNISLLGNRLYGRIPKEIGSISTLQSLVLEQNLLEGPLPEELGNLQNLTRLILSSNNFTGEIPATFANLQNLIDIRIDGNDISGEIPSFIGNWTQLVRLDLQGTRMRGSFPLALSTLTKLRQLRVSDFQSDRQFPTLQGLNNMTDLVLRNCSIYGVIPSYISEMSNLVNLDLSFNNFSGDIPKSFEAFTSSKEILNMYFTNNMLSGTIPQWVWNYKKSLDLSYNFLNDASSPHTCQQGSVNFRASYSSSDNDLLIPCLKRSYSCAGKAKNYNLFINCGGPTIMVGGNEYEEDKLQLGASTFFESPSQKWAFSSTGNFVDKQIAFYIASNISVLNMTDPEDPELYMTARKSPLSLKYYGLCLQKGNYTVQLKFAEIMFTNDQTFASLGRRMFDVSIQGQKVLKDFNIAKEANGTGRAVSKTFSVIVDGDALEIHFQWAGKGTNSIPDKGTYGPLISAIAVTPNFEPDLGEKKLSHTVISVIICASILVALLFATLCFFVWRKCSGRNDIKHLDLNFDQIASATQNFNDETNLIGRGGFGRVYRGVLSNGLLVAVKRLATKSSEGISQFITEIGIISALRHGNLVKLYCCCVEGNQLLLVLEYMGNGDLAEALFGNNAKQIELNWQTRRKICLGVASGLAYLHNGSTLKIIHRDIKATNILLDQDLNAKITDFGLAKLDVGESDGTDRIAGTIGYMAPELAAGELTGKADVYAFGVVMLELVSGRSNATIHVIPSLLEHAYQLHQQEHLIDLVDPRLGSNYSKEEALHMLNLALLCTNYAPEARPDMPSVVTSLKKGTPVIVKDIQTDGKEQKSSYFKNPFGSNISNTFSNLWKAPSTATTVSNYDGNQPSGSYQLPRDYKPNVR